MFFFTLCLTPLALSSNTDVILEADSDSNSAAKDRRSICRVEADSMVTRANSVAVEADLGG